MKSYNTFSENLNRAQELRQRQQDAVARHKASGNNTPQSTSNNNPQEKEHSADIAARERLSARIAAKRKAAKRTAMVQDVKNEIKQDSQRDK